MLTFLICNICLISVVVWVSVRQFLDLRILLLILFSWIASFVAGYVYVTIIPGDYHRYFYIGENVFGYATQFIIWLTQSFIKPLANNSLVLAFFIYAMFGFIGRLVLMVLYRDLLKTQANKQEVSAFCKSQRGMLMLALFMLWPPFLFWGSLLGKDSLQFMLLLLFLYACFVQKGFVRYVVIFFSLLVEGIIRPYMLCLILGAYLLYILFQQRVNLLYKTIAIVLCLGLGVFVVHIMQSKYGVNILDLDSVVNRSYFQQTNQSRGTAINVFWQSGGLSYWLALPWVFFANLFLPLPGLYTTNMHAWASAIMNMFLLYVCGYVLMHFKKIKSLFTPWLYNRIVFMLIWSLMGMLLIALVNTNLGLAARQKIPYVAMIFVIYGLLKFKFWQNGYKRSKYGLKQSSINRSR